LNVKFIYLPGISRRALFTFL